MPTSDRTESSPAACMASTGRAVECNCHQARIILRSVMGWHRGHLHEFIVGRMHYGIPDDDWLCAEPLPMNAVFV